MTSGLAAPRAESVTAAEETERIFSRAAERVRARIQAAERARRNGHRERLLAQMEDRHVPPGAGWYAPVRPAPTSLPEWLDDQVTAVPRLKHDPVVQLALAILEAARRDVLGAASAVREKAATLSALQQFNLYEWLSALAKCGYPPGAAMVRSVLGEWRALGLADLRPEPDPLPVGEMRITGNSTRDVAGRGQSARQPASPPVFR